MPKLVVSLTDSKIKSAISMQKKSSEKNIKLSDGGGLYLLLDTKGGAYWRFDYVRPITKKRATIAIGVYPSCTLASARAKRGEFREQLVQNIDPAMQKKREAEITHKKNTFKLIANEYRKTEELEPSTQRRNQFVWDKLYAAIGDYPIDSITPSQILEVCRIYERQGKTDSAKRMRSKASQVFRYAIALGLCQFNVADQISGILKVGKTKHRSAITDEQLLGQLLRNIYNSVGRGDIAIDYAVKILPHVFVRPGELRGAKWADIDFENRVWKYTPPKTKNQTALQHIVPLSDQVITLFKELHQMTGYTEYCFVSMRDQSKTISESTINKRLKQYGFENGETTGHGFRATARTLLDEVLKFPIERIEQQLAHQVRDMHGRAYNRTKYLEERTVMMQAWSDYLDQLMNKATD
ncbi:tyrosine-type recombinase/integrase [Acinetobacter towneri]|uniref:tyrosine-type recombinase/integrase n=1 Tax=Acinetobacter towneri TaxID=202956 RepID=UPI00188D25CC|nr:integrase arm-type DNA-binding domain-containing protein [Acinetobacter towneri]MBF4521911.1 integrase arm-type DNA-binding domain-containing protein [Acinetobacter towneri]MCO8058037.1 integrase arm-type DNA-binding domain-containing protein [Acinetobacter towneri]MCO8063683.1 integrase arm-type DNA-binding domain-containing protein [Acinetobacter towneri]